MARFTLNQAAALAPDSLAALTAEWGSDRVARAMAKHASMQLRCDTAQGTTFNRHGNQSRFVSWSAEDTAFYATNPGHVFSDFFAGTIGNSCSRDVRGLPL